MKAGWVVVVNAKNEIIAMILMVAIVALSFAVITTTPALALTDYQNTATEELAAAEQLAAVRLEILNAHMQLEYGISPTAPMNEVVQRVKELTPKIQDLRRLAKRAELHLSKAAPGIDKRKCSLILQTSVSTYQEAAKLFLQLPSRAPTSREYIFSKLKAELQLSLQHMVTQELLLERELGITPLTQRPVSCPFKDRERLLETIVSLQMSFQQELIAFYGVPGLRNMFEDLQTASRLAETYYRRERALFVPKQLAILIGQGLVFGAAVKGLTFAGLSAKAATVAVGAPVGALVGWHVAGSLSADHEFVGSSISEVGLDSALALSRALGQNDKDLYLRILDLQLKARKAAAEFLNQQLSLQRQEYSFITTGLSKHGSVKRYEKHLSSVREAIHKELDRRSL